MEENCFYIFNKNFESCKKFKIVIDQNIIRLHNEEYLKDDFM